MSPETTESPARAGRGRTVTTPTERLAKEHRVVLAMLDALEAALDPWEETAIREIVRFFDERLILHRRKEEEILFPAMGRRLGTQTGPIACMLEEHRQEKEHVDILRAAIRGGSDAETRARAIQAGRHILNLLRNHIFKEDHILFPLAENVLSDEEMMEISRGMDTIGYCFSECEGCEK